MLCVQFVVLRVSNQIYQSKLTSPVISKAIWCWPRLFNTTDTTGYKANDNDLMTWQRLPHFGPLWRDSIGVRALMCPLLLSWISSCTPQDHASSYAIIKTPSNEFSTAGRWHQYSINYIMRANKLICADHWSHWWYLVLHYELKKQSVVLSPLLICTIGWRKISV